MEPKPAIVSGAGAVHWQSPALWIDDLLYMAPPSPCLVILVVVTTGSRRGSLYNIVKHDAVSVLCCTPCSVLGFPVCISAILDFSMIELELIGGVDVVQHRAIDM